MDNFVDMKSGFVFKQECSESHLLACKSDKIFKKSLYSTVALLVLAGGVGQANAQNFVVKDGTTQTATGPDYSPAGTGASSAALYATGKGSTLIGNNLTITHSGATNAYMVYVSGGGRVELTDSTIVTAGAYSSTSPVNITGGSSFSMTGGGIEGGVTANASLLRAMTGSDISLKDVSIINNSASDAGRGIIVEYSTSVLDNVKIQARGLGLDAVGIDGHTELKNGTSVTSLNSSAVRARGTFIADDFTITGAGHGFETQPGAQLVLSNGTITSTGTMLTGNNVTASTSNAALQLFGSTTASTTLDATNIRLVGKGAVSGLDSGGMGKAELKNSSISVENGYGVRFSTRVNDFTMTGGSIDVSGDTGIGVVYAALSTDFTPLFDGVTITTQGKSAHAIYGYGAGAIAMRNGSISTIGAGAVTAYLTGGASLALDAMTITSEGANSQFLYLTGTQATKQTATVTDTTYHATAGHTAITAVGGVNDVTLTHSVIDGGTGALLRAIVGNDGVGANLTVAADNAYLIGNAYTDAVSTSSLSLENGSVWEITTRESATNALTSSLTNLTNNGSIVRFSAPTGDVASADSYKTLTVNNYHATDGAIYLNTFLGSDTSPSDKLIIDGGVADGTTELYINNTATYKDGAKTKVDGIRIIETINGGTTTDDAFTLANSYETKDGQKVVIGGAYAYSLHQNGIADPADGNWYLRSVLKDGSGLRYGASTPVYEAYPQTLLALNALSTLRQRNDNRYWSNAGNVMIEQGDGEALSSTGNTPTINTNGVWGHIEGGHSRFKSNSSTTATDYDIDTFKLQAGIDGQLYESEAGKLIGGITVQYGHASTNANSFFGDGDISTDGYGVGGTLTWYGNNGLYVDGQAHATWYNSDLSSVDMNSGLINGNNAFGYAFGVEAGKRIVLNQHWALTPQAQLAYSGVDFSDFTDSDNVAVHLNRGNSLQGRLGLAVERQNSWQNAQGMQDRVSVYGLANLYYEFLQGTKVDVVDVSFASRNERLWGGLGFGGSYNWNDDKYSVYGEGLINTSLSNFGDSYSLKGQLGFKVKW